MRVFQGQFLIYVQELVSAEPPLDDIGGQCIDVVLANTGQWLPRDETIERILILQQLRKIRYAPKLPFHVAGSPKAGITVADRLIYCIGKPAEHAIDVKLAVSEVILGGG